MSKLQVKAFVYQLLCFVIFFLATKFMVSYLTSLKGFTVSLIAFVIGTFLAPKFMATKTQNGEKLFMKWIFLKGMREVS